MEENNFYIVVKSTNAKRNGVEYCVNKDSLTIGRAPESDIQVPLNNISRKHAEITKETKGYLIKDTDSTNGVYLNGKKIEPSNYFPLIINDQFTLGPLSESPDVFTFIVKAQIKDQFKPTTSVCMSPPRKIPKKDKNSEKCVEETNLKKKVEDLTKKLLEKEDSERLLKEKLLEKQKEQEEKEMILLEKLREKEKEKEESEKQMLKKIMEKEEEQKKEFDREREIILKQNADIEKNYKERLQESNRENEQRLRQIVANQKQTIIDEKTKVEQSLLQEMSDRDKDFQEKQQKEKDRLTKELAAIKTKAEMLETKLSETNLKEQEKAKDLKDISELFETEMNCSICSEIFVVAMHLGCDHTFCQDCITQWKQKKNDCPICRKKIESESRDLVINNFIDKMVEKLPEEMKVHRQNIIKEREQRAKEKQTANNIANYLGMLNARGNEPTVVINRLGVPTGGVPLNARAGGFVDLTRPNNGAPQPPRNIQTTYQNQTVPITRPAYIFPNAQNANSHAIRIDANTIVRVMDNYRMPVNPPETRVHLERLLPATMGRFVTGQPQAQNVAAIPTIHLPQYPPVNRGRTSVLNLTRNIMPAPARPNEPIVITDSDDDAQTPNRGRAPPATSNRARWSGRGQTHQQRN